MTELLIYLTIVSEEEGSAKDGVSFNFYKIGEFEMISGAIFDLDGTLIDSMPVWTDIGARYLKTKGIEVDKQFYDDVRFLKVLDYAGYINKRYGLNEDAFELKLKINDMMEYYYFNEFVLKDGVKEFLEFLKNHGVKLAVATATDAYLVKRVLERNGVYDMFDGFFSCRDYNTSKDEPKIFELALEKLGTKRDETYIFEDALYAMKTAKKAGFPVCAVYDSAAKEHEQKIKEISDIYLDSFLDAQKAFAALVD